MGFAPHCRGGVSPRHTHLPFDVIAFIILKSVNYVLGHFVNYVITLHSLPSRFAKNYVKAYLLRQ